MDQPADLTDDLWRILGSVAEWVRFADAKAGATLAVDGVMVVLLAGRLTRAPSPAAATIVVLSVALALAAMSAPARGGGRTTAGRRAPQLTNVVAALPRNPEFCPV